MIRHLMLIGCGKMGGAILEGLLQHFNALKVSIIEPRFYAEKAARFKDYDVTFYENLSAFPENLMPDVILFAIKPQMLDHVLHDLNGYPRLMEALGISIVAGKTFDDMGAFLKRPMPLVRIMPNTPAAIGKGVFLAVPHHFSKEAHRVITDALFKAIGDVYWLPREEQIDGLTTLSGCGPAYVFLLLETLTKAAQKLGIDENLALDLAKKTVWGSAALALASDEKPEQLRRNVTSPKGMTEAALNVLMENDIFQKLFDGALKAAETRAKELRKV